MNKAIVRWNEEDHMWELLLQAAGEKEWTWSKGWLIRDVDQRSGNAWVFDDILCTIARLQEDDWTVVVRV